MKIESVEYALIPYGPATGDRALIVKVVEDDPTSEQDTPENTAKAMFSTLKTLCEANSVLTEQLELALIAKTQFYFAGECLVAGKNSRVSSTFFDLLSMESLNRQKSSVHVTKLRPPFLGFIGKPTQFSGADSFYENFNYLLITCGLDGITDKNYTEYYRDFAMIEISRHQFCCFSFKISNQEDLRAFEFHYRDRHVVDIDPRRIYFIPATESAENIKLVAEYCLKTGYRFGIDSSKYCTEALAI